MDLGLSAEQLLIYVIRPTLEHIGWESKVAEQLVLGTGITESRLRYLKQIGGGPALGIYQMEPATYRDIFENYLRFRPEFEVIQSLRDGRDSTGEEELIYNLAFATAMCRAHYRRMPAALPKEGDSLALASYWKEHYNTKYGSGTIMHSQAFFERAIETSEWV